MPEIGTSGSMSGDGKRGVAEWPKLPRPSSTLPCATSKPLSARRSFEPQSRSMLRLPAKWTHWSTMLTNEYSKILNERPCKTIDKAQKFLTRIEIAIFLTVSDPGLTLLLFDAIVSVLVMETEHVRYFLAICDELSFTRAAQKRGVKQPSLSEAITRMEQAIGGDLFVRCPTDQPWAPVTSDLRRLKNAHYGGTIQTTLAVV
jgi:regulatory helix-turn-helix LysR family protein